MIVPRLLERGARLLRIASAPYPLAAQTILDARTLEDLRRLTVGKIGLGFNDQILRIAYLCWLFRAAECSVFMETGTYKGVTALAAHRLFETDVLTVEARLSAYASSRVIAWIARVRGIHFERGDSARALSRWLSGLPVDSRPMIYLDAHWFKENPLRRELAATVARGNCVVVIDDCRVERDPDFGFDSQDFGEGSPWTFAIEIRSFADLLPPERVLALQPSYPAASETGRVRGSTILLVDVALPAMDRTLASSLFSPVSLIQRVARID
jgi:hypothetical protein